MLWVSKNPPRLFVVMVTPGKMPVTTYKGSDRVYILGPEWLLRVHVHKVLFKEVGVFLVTLAIARAWLSLSSLVKSTPCKYTNNV